MKRAYHHGDLRRAVLDGALEAIAVEGPAALSMREIARRAGVSHAAPAHHFGDKAGVLTAIAAEGYRLLAEATRAALEETGDFTEGGIAYVRFAIEHPAHYAVMFRRDLHRPDDPEVVEARAAGTAVIAEGVRRELGEEATDREVFAGVAGAWSFVHGFATLWLSGNFDPARGSDWEPVARAAAAAAFRLGPETRRALRS